MSAYVLISLRAQHVLTILTGKLAKSRWYAMLQMQLIILWWHLVGCKEVDNDVQVLVVVEVEVVAIE